MNVSEKGGAINPSVTLEISAKAKAMKAEGKSVIAFTVGEPDFNTPSYVIDAAKYALDAGMTKYTPTSGIPELKKAIVRKFREQNGLDYRESAIVVSDGAKSSLYHAMLAVINEGDEVIIPSPYWITYVEQVGLCGGKSVAVDTSKSGYKLKKDDFIAVITDRTKAVVINSPCNPTGAVYSEEELKDIADVAEEYGLEIISDEIYEELVFDGGKHVSIASLSEYAKNHTIVINGVSKSYAMTGWRIGYLAAPENVAKAISAIQGHTTSNACSFSQYAAYIAMTADEGKAFIEGMRAEFDSRRRLLSSLLDGFGVRYVMPEGAFYIFMHIGGYIGKSSDGHTITGSVSFAERLLERGVAVIPGAAFGDDKSVRLAYTVSKEDIEEGARRLGAFLTSLR